MSVQILYKNVAHPKLVAYIKRHSWLMESGKYLTSPQNQSEFKGGILHYLESIEEVSFLFRCHLVHQLMFGNSHWQAKLIHL